MKCVGYFLFYYFQYCVSKVGRAFEGKPVLMFANGLGLADSKANFNQTIKRFALFWQALVTRSIFNPFAGRE